jgi:hypothetical protein
VPIVIRVPLRPLSGEEAQPVRPSPEEKKVGERLPQQNQFPVEVVDRGLEVGLVRLVQPWRSCWERKEDG